MKFKNIKKEAKENKSPNNSRTIPVFDKAQGKPSTFLKIYKVSLKVFTVFIFVLAVVVVGLDLQANTQTKQAIDLEREKLTRELKFWEDFIAKHQDFKDAYFQASILEYRLGAISKAKKYAKKGLTLDPNSKDGRKIEELLNK